MLTKKFVEEAAIAAQLLANKGQVVLSRPGSVVDCVSRVNDGLLPVVATIDPSAHVEDPVGQAVDTVLAVANSVDSINSGNQMDTHSEAMGIRLEEETRKLRVIARLTREYVMPLIKDLHDKVQTGMQANNLGRAAQYNIVTGGIPALYTDPTFVRQMEPYTGLKVNENLTPTCHAPRLPVEDLRFMLRTGSEHLDALIQSVVGGDDAKLTYIWESFFVDVKELEGSEIVRDFRTIRRVLFNEGIDDLALVATYFFSEAIIRGNLPEGFTYVSQGEDGITRRIEDNALMLRDIVGAELRTRARSAFKAVQDGKLVIKYTDTEVHVVKDVYDQFLTKGGTNEMLYGNLFNRTRLFNEEDILANGNALEEVWARNLTLLLQADATNADVHKFQLAYDAFAKQLDEAVELEGPESSLNLHDLMADFRRQYKRLERSDTDDFVMAAAKLVCRVRYAGTDIENIIMSMFEIKRKHPDLSADNVATLAFVDYIADCISNDLVLARRA